MHICQNHLCHIWSTSSYKIFAKLWTKNTFTNQVILVDEQTPSDWNIQDEHSKPTTGIIGKMILVVNIKTGIIVRMILVVNFKTGKIGKTTLVLVESFSKTLFWHTPSKIPVQITPWKVSKSLWSQMVSFTINSG